jgi:dTDP-glucose pyrophosphorylase
MIFNIDTIRLNLTWPKDFGDGFIEVFESDEGHNWSFIKPLTNQLVAATVEKVRISNLCSTGLYGFSSLSLFRTAYDNTPPHDTGERFIAPLYNYLIQNGSPINYRIVKKNEVIHCGVPIDYEHAHSFFSSNPEGT